jgi:hypothetical protein
MVLQLLSPMGQIYSWLLVLCYYIRYQIFPGSEGYVLALISQDNDAFPYAWMLTEHCLDFSEFNAETSQFDLLIDTTNIFNGTISSATGQIPSAV